MKFFVNEYEAEAGDSFKVITSKEFDHFLNSFNREQTSFDPVTRLDYALKNQRLTPSDQIMWMFDNYTVVIGIHQDSERDIFICQ